MLSKRLQDGLDDYQIGSLTGAAVTTIVTGLQDRVARLRTTGRDLEGP